MLQLAKWTQESLGSEMLLAFADGTTGNSFRAVVAGHNKVKRRDAAETGYENGTRTRANNLKLQDMSKY